MTGQFRQLLDRLYGADMRSLRGKQLYFIFQGAGPSQDRIYDADFLPSGRAGVHGYDNAIAVYE